MNPADLIPAVQPLPVHWGWLWFLQLLTFFLHLVCMNIMLGTSLTAWFAAVLSHRAPASSEDDPGKDGYRKLPFAMAFTINSGVAPLLFLQVLYGQLIYTSSILMAVYWLAVIGFLIMAYYGAYLMKYRYERTAGLRPVVGGLIALPLLWTAFVFTNNMTLMQNPGAWRAYFDNDAGTMLNWADPVLLPRFLHFVIASLALAGLYRAVTWTVGPRQRASRAAWHRQQGLRWYIWASSIQMGVGVWFLIRLPEPVRRLALGSDFYCTGLLLSGLGLGLAGIVLALRQKLWPTVAATLSAVLAMAVLRDLIRQAYLAPYFKISEIPVQAHYGPMIFFMLVLLGGIALIICMLRRAGGAVGGGNASFNG